MGIWFPNLPGCLSAGDTLDEAMLNAPEALELWAGEMIESGQKLSPPRTLTELKTDSEVAQDLATFMVALIRYRQAYVSMRPNDLSTYCAKQFLQVGGSKNLANLSYF
ncbi:MAG: type II toxin-antitoxin system HicB family antitoxin [Methylocella sp.]